MVVGTKYELDEVKCPTCGREDFSSKTGVRKHHSIVHNERIPNLICESCGDPFFYKTRRAKCEKCVRLKREKRKERRQNKNQSKPIPCKRKCKKRFKTIRGRNQHHNEIHGKSLIKVKCDNCGHEEYYEESTIATCECGSELGEVPSTSYTLKKTPEPCPNCSKEFVNMGQHWKSQNCKYPTLSREQKDIIRGLIMSDAGIQKSENNNLRISLTEPAFLEWLAEKVGCICNTNKYPKQTHTPEEAKQNTINSLGAENVDPDSEYKAKYSLLTRSHPFLNEFDDWYVPEKRYPLDTLELTPTVAKMWYIGDGTLHKRKSGGDRAGITCKNERDRLDEVADLIRDQGFDVYVMSRGAIRVTSSDTPAFLEWLGEAPPGFEYKWISE